MSRVKDNIISQDRLKGTWKEHCWFEKEAQALADYHWLTTHNHQREYVLVRVETPGRLDDDIPF
jgi:hypothetical protein